MQFDLNKSLQILSRTPTVLERLLSGLSDEWIRNNEGPNTWSPYDILGHLIHGEKKDWIPRIKIILSEDVGKNFESFDRFAQLKNDQSIPIQTLLNDFKILRNENLQQLRAFNITKKDLRKTGIHPELGTVTLKELLSTWTVHDLSHINQIARVMAKQHRENVGSWSEFLNILK